MANTNSRFLTPLATFAIAVGCLVGSPGSSIEVAQASPPPATQAVESGPSTWPSAAKRTFTIVAMGDSYGSGEGAPDQPGKYAVISFNRWLPKAFVVWTQGRGGKTDEQQCHRSNSSGFARAIGILRTTFAGRVNIDFNSFACSGAAIRYATSATTGSYKDGSSGGGLLTPYEGMPPENSGMPDLPSQVEQANSFLGARTADAVLVDAGGNDSGFARMLFLCAVKQYISSLFGDCAHYQGKNLYASQEAIDVLNSYSAPTAIRGSDMEDLAEGDLQDYDDEIRCTSLTYIAAAQGSCTPILAASYDLLAKSLRGEDTKTWVPCSVDERIAAWHAWRSAHPGTSLPSVGTEVSAGGGITCVYAGVGLNWAKVRFIYPHLNRPARHVYLNTYPNPLTDSAGNLCDTNSSKDGITGNLTTAESDLLAHEMSPRLNGAVYAAAQRNGNWSAVTVTPGVGHGLCAAPADRWFNTNMDALPTMGNSNFPLANIPISSGFAHPNAEGYQNIYAWNIAASVRTQICTQFALKTCPDLSLTPPTNVEGSVSGIITGASDTQSSHPLAGIDVRLTDALGNSIAATTTDGSGYYEFDDVASNLRYKIACSSVPTGPNPGYLSAATDPFLVGSAEDVEKSLRLYAAARATGRVLDPAGHGIAGIAVEVFAPEGPDWDIHYNSVGSTTTSADGTYSLGDIPGGTGFKVRFSSSPAADPHYRMRWYPAAATFQQSQAVDLISGGQVTLSDVILDQGVDTGSISGSVYDEDGEAAVGVVVSAYSDAGALLGTTEVTRIGSYTLDDVPVGRAWLQFTTGNDAYYRDYGLQEMWYPAAAARPASTPVDVVATETAKLPSVTMKWGGRVQLEVRDMNDHAVTATVRLYGAGGTFRALTTDIDGLAVFTGVPAGDYRLFIDGPDPYVDMWALEQVSADTAGIVRVQTYDRWIGVSYLRKVPDAFEWDAERVAGRAVEVSWEQPFAAITMNVQRKTGRTWTSVASVPASVASFTDSSAAAKARGSRCYRMRATALNGLSNPWTTKCTVG